MIKMENKKLFLLDAYALIYRAYYALIRAPRVTSKGFNTSAIFGFCNTLDEILRKESPTHIAVCFDPKGGHTFRHEAYSEYKAQRDAQPEDITLSIPYIKRIIEAYNIPIIEMERYEADDIIGTLAQKAEREGYITYMMTPDKDYGQLVTDKILMYRPSLRGQGFEIRGVKEICERYGIDSPIQVIDLLALEGDASDNIPGCPGVGEKTASKLIREWGSVENLLEHTAELKGALQKKVIENADKIKFSKFLATIKTDVPVDIDFKSLMRSKENTELLREIYTELEFKTFLSRLDRNSQKTETKIPEAEPESLMGSLFEIDYSVPVKSMPSDKSIQHTVVDDPNKISVIIKQAISSRKVAVSLHATGTEAMTAVLKGIAIASDGNGTTFIELPENPEIRKERMSAIEPLFSNSDVVIASHDVKRDMILLRREGIGFTARYFDTSVAHYLLQPEMRHTLSQIALTYLGVAVVNFDNDQATRKSSAEQADKTGLTESCEKADVVLRLVPLLKKELLENGLDRLMNEIELPFVEVLADMEWTGVRIDTDELAALSRQLTDRVVDLEQQVYALAGEEFNIGSPMQVGEILFSKLKIDENAKRTKRGFFSTTEEILEKHRNSHPIVGLILKIRGIRKLLATYINALPLLINRTTGRIHTTYNQTVTATGRISSTNPNLQNIPVRTDDGREIRRAFIANENDLFMSADYSQIELRLLADLSGDPDMIAAFKSGTDFHSSTAARIYGVKADEVTDDLRRKAKTANFGIVYGISAFGLSERLSIPRAEAKMLIDGYYYSYPRVKEYMNESIEQAREKGYVTTIMGRKRYLPDINSRNAVVRGYAERNAVNAPLQGSAADIIKRAMIDIYRDIRDAGLKSKMIMQVHDELIFNVVPDELPQLQSIVSDRMRGAYNGPVPLEVSSGVGKNWLEAH